MQNSCSTEHLSTTISQTLTQNLPEVLSEHKLAKIAPNDNTKIYLINKEA